MEYVGEVLSGTQMASRSELYALQGKKHHYFMALHNDMVIDATRKGNLSRFINHSCNPNCKTEKWISQRQPRVGIFAIKPIKAGTELVFDYQFISFGAEAQKCFCGEKNCKGIIGKTVARADVPVEHFEINDANMSQVINLLLRTRDVDEIRNQLKSINRTDKTSLLCSFLMLHGLRVLGLVLSCYGQDDEIVELTLHILYKLPIINKNLLEESKIEDKILGLKNSRIRHSHLVESLLNKWRSLKLFAKFSKEEKAASLQADDKQNRSTTSAGYSLFEEINVNHSKYRVSQTASPDKFDRTCRNEQRAGHEYLDRKRRMDVTTGKAETAPNDPQLESIDIVISRARKIAFSTLSNEKISKENQTAHGEDNKKRFYDATLKIINECLREATRNDSHIPPWPYDLAEKLANGIVRKEMRKGTNFQGNMSASIQSTPMTETKVTKIRDFVIQYLQRHGYVKESQLRDAL